MDRRGHARRDVPASGRSRRLGPATRAAAVGHSRWRSPTAIRRYVGGPAFAALQGRGAEREADFVVRAGEDDFIVSFELWPGPALDIAQVAVVVSPTDLERAYSLGGQKLRFPDIDWRKAARGAHEAMAPGARFQINAWTSSQAEVDVMIKAFEDAGFKNVDNQFTLGGVTVPGGVGTNTMIQGVK